jgi:long-subunit acyl-CoA synthetase (AMP-forming)
VFPFHPDFNETEDILVLPFSSGTTGLPKGVMLTHANVCGNYRKYTEAISHPISKVNEVIMQQKYDLTLSPLSSKVTAKLSTYKLVLCPVFIFAVQLLNLPSSLMVQD